MTAGRRVGEDVHNLFLQLTGPGKVRSLRKLLQAPFTLHERVLGLIDEEIEHAKAGSPARIVAKMNALAEPKVIQALYRASQAGVQIDLLVRGVCCLRPGIPGVSENIQVRSIVGRFLEHSRIFYFRAGGADIVYCSSADWMARNFFRRTESAFPLDSTPLRIRVVGEGLTVYLADDTQAWALNSEGEWARVPPRGGERVCAQELLMQRLGGGDDSDE